MKASCNPAHDRYGLRLFMLSGHDNRAPRWRIQTLDRFTAFLEHRNSKLQPHGRYSICPPLDKDLR